jgi:hypothetical protein
MRSQPECFCWTRFGTAAAQSSEQILLRKEQERLVNGGLFLWGIGNAIGPSIVELLRRISDPEVLFSPVKSTPRLLDATPPGVAAWTVAETLTGEQFQIPETLLVTSKYDPAHPKKSHYALVCSSAESLTQFPAHHKLEFGALRNLVTGHPIGASQVTAVVQQVDAKPVLRTYDVAIRARLVYPYFLRLKDPVQLSGVDAKSDLAEAVHQIWSSRLAFFKSEP